MANVDLEQHAFGYVVGDRVRVFTPTGYWTGTAERITCAGRLSVRDKDGKVIQFLPHGREVGGRTTSTWSAPLRSILPKHQQEERAKFLLNQNRQAIAKREFHDQLDRLRGMDLATQREEIAAQLELLLADVRKKTP